MIGPEPMDHDMVAYMDSGPDWLMYLDQLAPIIIVVVIALTIGWIATTWLRIKNGYPLSDAWGNPAHPLPKENSQQLERLSDENAQLRADLSRMKDRIATVERIVTDSGYHLNSEFDRLRDGEKERA
ncbi:hypothetical protein [Erythrobacter litoralis]|uniref:hypothetical protein n=1 Tax=Erythrobacter litoralis TaxID=39960 RepID=UPI00243588CB|nr:hypothetical protein [Erythrobacter litoralis]